MRDLIVTVNAVVRDHIWAVIFPELKGKLAELDARLEEIKTEALVLEAQKAAFATVIKVFDPRATSEAPQRHKRKDRSTPWSPRDRPSQRPRCPLRRA
jgi:hypothetical protein